MLHADMVKTVVVPWSCAKTKIYASYVVYLARYDLFLFASPEASSLVDIVDASSL